jgi:hypothetical protein
MQCNANAVWRKESWECGPQTANRMPLWRRGRVVSMCYGGVRAKATDTVVLRSHYWRAVRVLPPCMRKSRDSSMAIGARDAGTWYLQNKEHCRRVAAGWCVCSWSWFDDKSHASSPWPAVRTVSEVSTPQCLKSLAELSSRASWRKWAIKELIDGARLARRGLLSPC